MEAITEFLESFDFAKLLLLDEVINDAPFFVLVDRKRIFIDVMKQIKIEVATTSYIEKNTGIVAASYIKTTELE